MNPPSAEQAQNAAQAGIATEYADFWGHPVLVSGDVLAQALPPWASTAGPAGRSLW